MAADVRYRIVPVSKGWESVGMLRASHLSSNSRMDLNLLGKLGTSRADLAEIKQALDAKPSLELDSYRGTSLGDIRGVAKQLGIELPEARLKAVLGPPQGKPTLIDSKALGYPEPAVKSGPSTHHSAQMDVTLTADQLGAAKAKVLEYLEKTAPDLKSALEGDGASLKVLTEHLASAEARKKLGGKDFQTTLLALAKGRGPEHTSQDALLDFNSKFKLLAGSAEPGQAGVHQKAQLEHFSLYRLRDGDSFKLEGFTTDKVLVTVPPGGSVVILDGLGDQKGRYMPLKSLKVGDQQHKGVELSRSLVRHPDAAPWQPDPQFSIRVLDRRAASCSRKSCSSTNTKRGPPRPSSRAR